MATVFYKKSGRKYIPISEYHGEFSSSMGYGDHLVSVYPGGRSTRKIDPAFAPMFAAARYSRDAITSALIQA